MSLNVGDRVKFFNQKNAILIGSYYLTANKEYEVKSVLLGSGGTGFEIVDDDGDLTYCRFECCAHLKNNTWTKVEAGIVESIATLIKSTMDAGAVNN